MRLLLEPAKAIPGARGEGFDIYQVRTIANRTGCTLHKVGEIDRGGSTSAFLRCGDIACRCFSLEDALHIASVYLEVKYHLNPPREET